MSALDERPLGDVIELGRWQRLRVRLRLGVPKRLEVHVVGVFDLPEELTTRQRLLDEDRVRQRQPHLLGRHVLDGERSLELHAQYTPGCPTLVPVLVVVVILPCN